MSNEKNITSLDPNLFSNNGPHPKQIIQIKGRRRRGKSHLFHYIVAKTLLKGCDVYLINTDTHFNLFQLITVIERLINIPEKTHEESADYINPIVDDILNRIHILNVYEFQTLAKIMLTALAAINDNPNIKLLAIDSMNHLFCQFTKNPNFFSLNHYFLQKQMKKFRYICNTHEVTFLHIIITGFEPYMYLNYDYDIDYKFELAKYEEQYYAKLIYLQQENIEFKRIVIDKDYGLDYDKLKIEDDKFCLELYFYFMVLGNLRDQIKLESIESKEK